jgi:MATE family multidrug resistance protein
VVLVAFSSATLLHSIWCYYFIIYLDLGISGAAFANLLHAFMCFIITSIFLSYFAESKVPLLSLKLGIFDKAHVINYLEIGLPSIFMVCLEWWGFEIIVLMSGMFSETGVAA